MRTTVVARVAFCQVCLLVSALLTAKFLGLVPDPRAPTLEGRRTLCESLAVSCSLLAGRGDMESVEAQLQAVVSRNADVLSAGLRRSDQQLFVEVGDHASHWTLDESGRSSATQIYVPIMANNEAWGDVEVRFTSLGQAGFYGLVTSTWFRLFVFISLSCLMLFYLFLRKALQQLDPSKVVPQRVRAALDTLAEGLLVLDNKNRIVLANRAFAETLGRHPDELQGRRASALPWARDADQCRSGELPWVASGADQSLCKAVPLSLRLRQGEQRNFMVNSAPIVGDDGKARGVLASFDDVTDLETRQAELVKMLGELEVSRQEITRQNKELKVLATRDPLTGCLNRRSFFEEFEKQWIAAKRYNYPLSCVMVDIDHFKAVNDVHGHQVGDKVLKKVAATLQETARDSDIVSRYGGEEFCVLLPHIDLDGGVTAAERLRTSVKELQFPGLSISASFGVSMIGMGADNPQQLLHQADTCLYVAKRNGRDQVTPWNDSLAEMELDQSQVKRTPEPEEDDRESTIPFRAVTALLSALAYRDASTAEHSTRVADLCVETARGLVSMSDVYILEMAALLHDIGKIGVPDSILLKPGPLTDEEWKVMSIHDQIGVEIIRSSFSCPKLDEIVETHHAFFGGKARNQDLPTGEDIPIGARVLSIADAYDAMISDRVYRIGTTSEEAFAELRRCAGSQFDPQLVERFIAVVNEQQAVHPQPACATSKQTALQIGTHIEQLAHALDRRDIRSLATLAGRLKTSASQSGIPRMSEVASELERLAQEDAELEDLCGLTQELLDLCRATQKAYISVASDTTLPEDGTAPETDAACSVKNAS